MKKRQFYIPFVSMYVNYTKKEIGMFDYSQNLKPDLQNPKTVSVSLGLVSILFGFGFESETKKKRVC